MQGFLILLVILCPFISNGFAFTPGWHFLSQDVNQLHSKSADIRIHYGQEPSQYADLRLPSTEGPYPVVIIIHGGCWTASFANLQNTSALADALRDKGYATWNVEYRRLGELNGGWPETFNDVANAVDYLPEISKKYALNLHKVIVIGHSAGGHLALWLAARHRLSLHSELYKKNPLTINGVISLGGVPDLKRFRQKGMEICKDDVVWNLIGGKEEHYKDTSPIELLPLNVKQFLIYGEDEQVVPAQFSQLYVRKAEKLGDFVRVVRIKYAAHHEYNVPNSITWPPILESVETLIPSQ